VQGDVILILEDQELIYGGDSWSIVIIRHGYLVREHYTFNVLIPTRFDIWSGTKSFTGTAWGLLLDDSQQVDLDSPAYPYIPEGYPLSDSRKERILIRHLLTMTSGIPGENRGVRGMPTATDCGPLACARALSPIGIENLSWDVQGGSGFLGPHTNAHTGVHISAWELARFGYLMLRRGAWAGKQLIPEWWLDLATRSSQALNPNYGYTWWVNTAGTHWPSLPKDAFALAGYRSNRCYIIPSLDLVVARIGSGPTNWEEQGLITAIVGAITSD